MWTSWNTERLIEKCPRQRVEYMQHIPFPSTRTDVVKETTVQSKRFSEECGSIVTHDLAIAKIAKKIQSEGPDEFKEVFIHFTLRRAYFLLLVNLLKGLEAPIY